MPRKRNNVNFDGMVKSFMQYYNIPTKQDLDRVVDRLDRMEKLIRQSSGNGRSTRNTDGSGSSRSASSQVLDVIKSSKEGVDFRIIKSKTGFDDKKLRNIIFRLHKMEKIERVSRGVYAAVDDN